MLIKNNSCFLIENLNAKLRACQKLEFSDPRKNKNVFRLKNIDTKQRAMQSVY